MLLEKVSDSERRGIAAVFATACLAFLAWAFPDMSRLVTIPGAVIAAGFAVWFLWPEITTAGAIALKGGLLRAVAALVLASAALAFAYWYYSHMKTNGWYWHIQFIFPTDNNIPAKPSEPMPEVRPPPAAPTWLTPTDIAYVNLTSKTATAYSPDELLHMFATGHDTAAFVGKWIKIEYSLSSGPFVDRPDTYGLAFGINSGSALVIGALKAYFDQKRWEAKLFLLKPPDKVRAFCQYEGVEEDTKSIPPLVKDTMIVHSCEMY